MPKATRVHSTRTAPLRRTSPESLDPIFAAIENHKKLDKAWLDLERAGAQRSDVDRASDAADKAAWKMARTKPRTAAGASALLSYITTGNITGLFELGETYWHETAFRNVAVSLATITRRPRLAA